MNFLLVSDIYSRIFSTFLGPIVSWIWSFSSLSSIYESLIREMLYSSEEIDATSSDIQTYFLTSEGFALNILNLESTYSYSKSLKESCPSFVISRDIFVIYILLMAKCLMIYNIFGICSMYSKKRIHYLLSLILSKSCWIKFIIIVIPANA